MGISQAAVGLISAIFLIVSLAVSLLPQAIFPILTFILLYRFLINSSSVIVLRYCSFFLLKNIGKITSYIHADDMTYTLMQFQNLFNLTARK